MCVSVVAGLAGLFGIDIILAISRDTMLGVDIPLVLVRVVTLVLVGCCRGYCRRGPH